MIRNLLFFLVLIFAVTIQINAQVNTKLTNCKKIAVQDSSRRSFDNRNSFKLDVDGDGKLDTITPRTYAVKTKRKVSGKSKVGEVHWIAFDLKTSKGRVTKSFFSYDYGTNEADYWVYAFVPCKISNDGKPELLFYSGDDTSQETIVLVNRGSVFKIYSRKVEELSNL